MLMRLHSMSNELAVAADADELRVWSLCWQAAQGRDFFVHPTLVELIRDRLIAAHAREGRVLIDFVLLPTEIHAITQLRSGDSVASVARSFGAVVSRWVRGQQPRRGPVLAGPYCAVPLDSDEAVRQDIRMLAWRPVCLGESSSRNQYRHAALRYALGLRPARGFETTPLLRYFGASTHGARQELRKWLSSRPSEPDWRAWELTRGLQLATDHIGPDTVVARKVGGAAAALIAAGGGYGIEGALMILERWVAAKISPAEPLDLHVGANALASRGRALVGGLAVAHRLCPAASVARHFQRAKATLCEQMRASRSRPVDRLILRTDLRRILEEAALLHRGRSP